MRPTTAGESLAHGGLTAAGSPSTAVALRLLSKRRATAVEGEPRRIAGMSERLLLVVGLTLFTLVAAASIIAAVAT